MYADAAHEQFASIVPPHDSNTSQVSGFNQRPRSGASDFIRQSPSLVLDIPLGTAFRVLESTKPSPGGAPASSVLLSPYVVVTYNSCAEYSEDLWELSPSVLLVGPKDERQISDALARAALGERYRIGPLNATELTAGERRVLYHLARGWSNREIAVRLSVTEKTVRNTVTLLFCKLQMESRMHAALYYWGIQGTPSPVMLDPNLFNRRNTELAANPVFFPPSDACND